MSNDSWGPLTPQRGGGAGARDVLDRGARERPDRVFALVSGGHDSLTAMHVAHGSSAIDLDGVVHIDTGIGVPQTRAFVERRADDLGLEFIRVTSDWNRGNSWLYRRIVREYGFPGPPIHGTMYARLKEKPLNRFRMEYADQQVAFVSGVRRHESDRRMETVPDRGLGWTDGTLWLSPLVDWTGSDVREYRRDRDLPMNPVVERLEMSGECLCGAYADREELRMLKLFYPDVYRCLTTLELDAINRARRGEIDPEYALWGHGSYGQRELDARLDDDQQTLCSDCAKRGECDAWTDRDTDPVTVGEALGGIEPGGEDAIAD